MLMASKTMVTIGQVEAAHALLWSQGDLADASGVSHPRPLQLFGAPWKNAGVIFLLANGEGPGVRLRKRR
jgi:hypothetical protein